MTQGATDTGATGASGATGATGASLPVQAASPTGASAPPAIATAGRWTIRELRAKFRSDSSVNMAVLEAAMTSQGITSVGSPDEALALLNQFSGRQIARTFPPGAPPTGASGSTGATGATGGTGASDAGASGASGASGSSGATGASDAGASGASGASGPNITNASADPSTGGGACDFSVRTDVASTVTIQYGTDITYGTSIDLSGDGVATAATGTVTGLTPGTTYHYRALAVGTANGALTTGPDNTFVAQ